MFNRVSRRQFMRGVAGAGAAAWIGPAILHAQSPNEKLNLALVGVGGRGRAHLKDAMEFGNVVALCDIDEQNLAAAAKHEAKAKKYVDFRSMLEQKDIDAVVIATPDHTHAVIAMAAMRLGKHVYLEKPLAHNIWETRMLTEAARSHKVATQMGNQGHSGEGYRLLCEWIQAGAIGNVREVHCFTDRPTWPQGIHHPKDSRDCPQHVHWSLWLGPAPERAYHPAYHPFGWRAWWDYGTGALGDMACHIMDGAVWALKLGAPQRVSVAEASAYNADSFPASSVLVFDFPAREAMPPVRLFWHDGKRMPPRPLELEPDRRMGDGDNGSLFIGDKGTMMTGAYGDGTRIIPEEKMKAFLPKAPSKTIPRVRSHFGDWVSACKGGTPAGANFDYSGPFTEMVLLGNLALRMNRSIEWDSAKLRVTNIPEANQYVNREYRKGWAL